MYSLCFCMKVSSKHICSLWTLLGNPLAWIIMFNPLLVLHERDFSPSWQINMNLCAKVYLCPASTHSRCVTHHSQKLTAELRDCSRSFCNSSADPQLFLLFLQNRREKLALQFCGHGVQSVTSDTPHREIIGVTSSDLPLWA